MSGRPSSSRPTTSSNCSQSSKARSRLVESVARRSDKLNKQDKVFLLVYNPSRQIKPKLFSKGLTWEQRARMLAGFNKGMNSPRVKGLYKIASKHAAREEEGEADFAELTGTRKRKRNLSSKDTGGRAGRRRRQEQDSEGDDSDEGDAGSQGVHSEEEEASSGQEAHSEEEEEAGAGRNNDHGEEEEAGAGHDGNHGEEEEAGAGHDSDHGEEEEAGAGHDGNHGEEEEADAGHDSDHGEEEEAGAGHDGRRSEEEEAGAGHDGNHGEEKEAGAGHDGRRSEEEEAGGGRSEEEEAGGGRSEEEAGAGRDGGRSEEEAGGGRDGNHGGIEAQLRDKEVQAATLRVLKTGNPDKMTHKQLRAAVSKALGQKMRGKYKDIIKSTAQAFMDKRAAAMESSPAAARRPYRKAADGAAAAFLAARDNNENLRSAAAPRSKPSNNTGRHGTPLELNKRIAAACTVQEFVSVLKDLTTAVNGKFDVQAASAMLAEARTAVSGSDDLADNTRVEKELQRVQTAINMRKVAHRQRS